MMNPNKKMATVIVAKLAGGHDESKEPADEEMKEEELYHHALKGAAADCLKAFHSNDAEALKSALLNFHECVDAHAEQEEAEGEPSEGGEGY